MKGKTVLYKFLWEEGGYNQVRAASKKEALARIKKEFARCALHVALKTLKRLGKKQEESYWQNFPNNN